MKKTFSFIIGACIVLGMPFLVSAEGEAIRVATVNIYDAQIASQDNNDIKLTFDLSNREQIQPDVRYAVELIKRDKDTQTIIDEKVYPEVVNLGENQTIKKQIDYLAPQYLSGEFEVWLTARNQSGLMLSVVNPGKITLQGNNQYVEILSDSCYLKVAGEAADKKYTLTQGVDVKSEEKLMAYCDAINHFNAPMSVMPSFKTNWRTSFGQVVPTDSTEQPALTLAAGEKKQIQYEIAKAQIPQAYNTTITLQDQQNQNVSNSATFHYVLRGPSATIQNLRLDKDYYQKGDTAKASFFWTASADNFPDSRLGATENGKMLVAITIRNSQGQVCVAAQKELDQASAVTDYELPISVDCADPQIAVSIQNDKGNVLDQEDFNIKSKNVPVIMPSVAEKSPIDFWHYLIPAVIILAFIFSLLLILRHRKKSISVVIFLIIASGMLFSNGKGVRADTFSVGGNGCMFGMTTSYTVGLNKAVYSPSEVAVATGSMPQASCGNYYDLARLYITINGVQQTILNGGYAGAVYANVQSVPGGYDAQFMGKLILFCTAGHDTVTYPISYTVSAPCTCDAAINATHCAGSPYTNNCGASCMGTKGPSCLDDANFCQEVSYPSGNGCGTCTGTKLPIYDAPVCSHANAGNVCNSHNCGKSIPAEKAYCNANSNNGCNPLTVTKPLSDCSGCNDTMVTCPACPWDEVAP